MKLSPLDENGKPVDWWFAYKVPKLTKDASTASTTGYEYVYYDPNVEQVARSPHKMGDPDSSLKLTLDSAFKSRDATTGWILYNDEKPPVAKGKDDGNLGHTKGVIAFDTATKTAFWLLHSWPKYADPELPGMPTPDYGQTFLCVSLTLASASQLAAQMVNHQEPQVYDPKIPSTLDKKDPLFALTQQVNANDPADSNVLELKTTKGLTFQVIAKNRKWGKDFWNDLVGPTLKADMDVETWIRGRIPPTLDSDGIHKTFDVKYIDLSRLGAPWAWPESRDHAKWGITKDSHWICVGDINRMVSQEKRGGGTIALQDEKLWAALSKTDLVLAPPGHTRAEALALIKTTHGSHEAQPPVAAPEKTAAKPKPKGK